MAIEKLAALHAELEKEILSTFMIPASILNQKPEKQTFHELQQRLNSQED